VRKRNIAKKSHFKTFHDERWLLQSYHDNHITNLIKSIKMADETMHDADFYSQESPSPACSQTSMPIESPASSLHCSQQSDSTNNGISGRRRIDAHTHIVNSITDANRYPLKLERYFHEHDLMVPKDKDLDSIEANDKSWAMMRPCAPSATDGISWSFVDICGGLSTELLKVCHFFEVMNGLSNHHPWNGFVVPTTDISGGDQNRTLCLKYNKKDVVGVIDRKFVEHAQSVSLSSSDKKGVDTAKLLGASEQNTTGMQNTLLPLFKIQLGFTAAFFTADPPNAEDDPEAHGEQRQATFGVVTITSLRNVDSLKLIVV